MTDIQPMQSIAVPIGMRCVRTVGIVTVFIQDLGGGRGKVNIHTATAPLEADYIRYLFESTQTEVEAEQKELDWAIILETINGYAKITGDKARNYFAQKAKEEKENPNKDQDPFSKGGIILPP